jgi:hypothetical protein
MTTRSKTLGLAAFAAVAALVAMPRDALADYYVYCASSRIEVDSRDPEQMRTARSNFCVLGQFSTRSDAENFARRNFGGVRSSCSCR